MARGADVLRFPVAEDRIFCHVTVPNATATLRDAPDNPTGMSCVAVGMQHVAERFDDLALLFEECPEASYVPGMTFLDGRYTFVFQIPRRYRQQLLDMGWDERDVDVPLERTVVPAGDNGRVNT
jgi:hypothetical protein